MAIAKGVKAPNFECQNQNNQTVKLSDYLGQKVVLYFYPKDNTPTCTEEACNLRDNYKQLKKQGYKLFGVSPDSVKKHQNFIAKYELPFDLLADESLKMCHDYDVWGPKKLYGREYMGVYRTTFIIDEKGYIEEVIDKVESKNHAAQIMK